MKAFINKLVSIEKDISEEIGTFVLFAAFEREDLPGKWDIVVSAHWIAGSTSVMNYVIYKIHQGVGPQELLGISKVVFLEPTDSVVKFINKTIRIEHGVEEVKNLNVDWVSILHAYIISSNPDADRIRANIQAKTRIYHVIPNPESGWDVRRGGAERASAHFDSQREAIEHARSLSKNQRSELVIHGKDGRIRETDSYGRDPSPPKDVKSMKEFSPMGKDQHVVPHQGKWAVKGAGNTRATSVHDTQHAAIGAAKDIAKRGRSEVVIHRRDGRIRDKDSYGNDPVPPRDKKH